jgi:hypothetical protein
MSGYGYSLHTLKEWTTRSVLSLDTGSAALTRHQIISLPKMSTCLSPVLDPAIFCVGLFHLSIVLD